MWFIKLDKQIRCPCFDHDEHTTKLGCPICLGTGYKIKLIRAKGARQTTEDIGMRGEGIGYSEQTAVQRFFTLENLELTSSDIIVDNNEVFIVQSYFPGRTNMNKPVYYRTIATPKKMDLKIFLETFHSLLRRNGYG